jgi:carbamoyl-phosphate synthase large subunit
MKKINQRIAVTGLQRGDNPQPGAGIIKSVRRLYPKVEIIGLVYDAMESGIYAEEGPNSVHLMPFPYTGKETYFKRLKEIHHQVPFDILIPTLDSELDILVSMQEELKKLGVKCCIPDRSTLERRSKARLPELAKEANFDIPQTQVVMTLEEAYFRADELGYPIIIKGPFYDAKVVSHRFELGVAANAIFAEWGAPIILQKIVRGWEYNVMGIGDGKGGLMGSCSVRKTILSEKGKGMGAVTIHDEQLQQLCERMIKSLNWIGPFEIEVMKDEVSSVWTVIEMNPRFPAWVDFPSTLGANFPVALVEWICYHKLSQSIPHCAPGHFYLRHQIETTGHMNQLAQLLTGHPLAL